MNGRRSKRILAQASEERLSGWIRAIAIVHLQKTLESFDLERGLSLAKLRRELSIWVCSLAKLCDVVFEQDTTPNVEFGPRGCLKTLAKAKRAELLELWDELRRLVDDEWFYVMRERCAALTLQGYIGLSKQRTQPKYRFSEVIAMQGWDAETVSAAKAFEDVMDEMAAQNAAQKEVLTAKDALEPLEPQA